MMTTTKDRVLTIPNALSLYRLLVAPLIIWLAIAEKRDPFIVLICISLVTDILDGLIARTWGMESKLGARLDSIADDFTYLAALVGIFQFEFEAIRPHAYLLYAFIFMLVMTTAIPLLKFKKSPAYHLYSFRVAGYAQGFFLFSLFVFGFNVYFYFFALSFGILASAEVIAVTFIVNEPVTNAKGLYWVLQKRRLET